MLRIYFDSVGQRVLPPNMELGIVSARVRIVGRDHRIMPGDRLEKRDKNTALTLCKCVGIAEFMSRRRVQEWIEGSWGKEHVIYSGDESDYRVITEHRAVEIVPGAFPSSPPAKSPEGL